jgi:hypothetical protein
MEDFDPDGRAEARALTVAEIQNGVSGPLLGGENALRARPKDERALRLSPCHPPDEICGSGIGGDPAPALRHRVDCGPPKSRYTHLECIR